MQTEYLITLDEIQQKREKMIQSACIKGLTSEETIQYSQELDQLIYRYQRQNMQEKKRHNQVNLRSLTVTFA